MPYLLFFMGLGAGLATRSSSARRLVAAGLATAMELMMDRVMPRMMDVCFGQMSPDRREFMLAHCRGALEDVDKKYTTAQAT
jgi:hypothetical protein